MAQIISVPQPLPATPVPNSQAAQDNGVRAAVNPNLGFAQALAGQAAANAATPAPDTSGLPAYDPRASTVATSPIQADPSASPLHKMLASIMAGAGPAAGLPTPGSETLTTPTSPEAKAGNFILGDDATTKAMADHDKVAQFYSSPDAQNYLAKHNEVLNAAHADPSGMAAALARVIALGKAAPVVTANGKPMDNPAGVNKTAAETGLHQDIVHPFAEPHQYSEDEFVNALSGRLTWKHAAQLFGMQHYLTPQQQVPGDYLSLLHNQAGADETAYQTAAQGGAAAGALAKLDTARKMSAQKMEDSLRAMALQNQAYYQGQGIQ